MRAEIRPTVMHNRTPLAANVFGDDSTRDVTSRLPRPNVTVRQASAVTH